jgi:hypothetical protein
MSEMPDDAVLSQLLLVADEHLKALIRGAYEAGRKTGENAAREKVLSVFNATGSAPMPEAKTRQRGSLADMATVSRPLREAISMMNVGREGVGPKEVFAFVNRRPDLQLDIWQVRAGIKTLEKRGDLERVSRGRYRPSARLLGQSEDQKRGAPNSDELFGVPKANGAEPLSPRSVPNESGTVVQ